MSYQRKTRPKYVSDAFIILALTVGTIIGAGLVKADTYLEAYAKEQYINPLSQKDIKIIEVPTTQIVHELPTRTEDMIKAVFGDKADQAIAIAKCESGLRPEAYNGKNSNGSNDSGLFQINSVHGVSKRFLQDPLINTLIAKEIYDGRGNWSAWVCARKLGIQ